MTYLELINQVLRNLREDEVTSSTAAYSKLIGFFVKQAYIECANAYPWPQLDETQDVAIVANDSSFDITGDSGEGIASIHSCYNTTDKCFLRPSNYISLRDRLSYDTDPGKPAEYAYGGETDTSTSTIYIYPASSGSYTLRVSYNRKPNLSNTFNDSTVIKLPSEVIILKAWARAIAERGEDGVNSNLIEQQAQAALSDAIALYESNNNSSNTNWNVV